MATETDTNRPRRIAQWLLAILGAVNCIVIPMMFASQTPLFPAPGLYLIEIALVGVLGLVSVVSEYHDHPRWQMVPWLAAGILLAFVVLGGFSIGFFLIPATLAFLIVGVLENRRAERGLVHHLGLFVIAAVVQGAIMMVPVMFA